MRTLDLFLYVYYYYQGSLVGPFPSMHCSIVYYACTRTVSLFLLGSSAICLLLTHPLETAACLLSRRDRRSPIHLRPVTNTLWASLGSLTQVHTSRIALTY